MIKAIDSVTGVLDDVQATSRRLDVLAMLKELLAGEDLAAKVMRTASPPGITVSALTADTAHVGAKRLRGILWVSGTGTIALHDHATTAGNQIIPAYTGVVGQVTPFYDLEFTNGLYVDVTGTVSVVLFYW
jgi:hypothetical protein